MREAIKSGHRALGARDLAVAERVGVGPPGPVVQVTLPLSRSDIPLPLARAPAADLEFSRVFGAATRC